MKTSSLKWAAIFSLVISLAVLFLGGFYAKDRIPQYPQKVVDVNNNIIFTKQELLAGQDVFQKYGLMNHGSVWGHGSLRGMDFSATAAHLIGRKMREYYALQNYGKTYDKLNLEVKQFLDSKVIAEIKKNNYNKTTQTLVLSDAQVYAYKYLQKYFDELFKTGKNQYGFLPDTVKTDIERKHIASFFYFTAWAAMTNRADGDFTYTNNWPPDRTIGNTPSLDVFLWSIGGIISLFVGLGIVVYLVHRYNLFYGEAKGALLAKKLIDMPITNSQYQAAKFFIVVSLLFILQTLVGGLLAHFTVEPAHFYIPFIGKFIPYSWAKTWHLQLAVFWIATTWVGTAIYLAPIISGKEPKGQSILVNILFIAILIVALGSLFGEVLGIKGLLGNLWFYFGHQGWEFLELGRIWQILLFVGLLFWVFIVYRAVAAKLTFSHNNKYKALVSFYVFSAVLVVLFFGFGLFYGKGTHITIADYWRWFVVHIWVESIFEFFGVAIISLFLVILGLADSKSALKVAYFTGILVFLSGIIGTAHHYFWYGGPAIWLALGAVFSSLEPIPLILLVVRAWMEYRTIEEQGEKFEYKWPLMFLTASSVWNFVGAGIFGFLINLPIVNYYEHATYLTVNHGHTALFGVYGMLSLSLLTFSWRGLVKKEFWSDKLLKTVFYGLNGGLFLMALGTLFPVGILQLIDSYNKGLWFARSAEFYNKPVVKFLGTIRIVPDTIIILVGVIPLFLFLVRTYGHLKKPEIKEGENVWEKCNISFDENK